MRELAPAKLNLVLQVGRPRHDGLHPICSLMASIELADVLEVEPAGRDRVECPGVPGPNLAERALTAYREAADGDLPQLAVRIDKRIPVAAGLGGGSADAAAVLRVAERLCDRPLGSERLRGLAAELGADVPSQLEPRHALVTGAGETVEPLSLPRLELLLVPAPLGLQTGDVYAELDRMGGWRERLSADRVREVAALPVEELAGAVDNDLERAALSLRPELAEGLEVLRAAGALVAAVSGSGPTLFGLFPDGRAARRAADRFPEAIGTATR